MRLLRVPFMTPEESAPVYCNSNNSWCSEMKNPSCYDEGTEFLRTITDGVVVKVYLYWVLR